MRIIRIVLLSLLALGVSSSLANPRGLPTATNKCQWSYSESAIRSGSPSISMCSPPRLERQTTAMPSSGRPWSTCCTPSDTRVAPSSVSVRALLTNLPTFKNSRATSLFQLKNEPEVSPRGWRRKAPFLICIERV
jgi:hypothetical protein